MRESLAPLGQRRLPAGPRLEAAAEQAGFADVATYVRQRYIVDQRSAREIGEEAGVDEGRIRRQLADLAVPMRRGNHRFYDERRGAKVGDPVQALIDKGPPTPFDSWSAYLKARTTASHLRITEIAAELGVSMWYAQRLAATFDRHVARYFRSS